MVSVTVSVPHVVDELGRLVPTAVGSDEGPATGAISVSGRAISGSGLGTTSDLSECISARTTPPIDRRVTENAKPYQSVWAVKLPPVGLYPFPVDPRWRPGPTRKSGS